VGSGGVASAVRRLLGDGTFGQRARHVANEIASMPSPDEVAAVLETLTY
jgi:hypothetical protein